MAKMYYDDDVDLNVLDGRRIAVLGYGNQGRPHALNLKESGCEVVVGLREGSPSWPKVEAEGLEVMTTIPTTTSPRRSEPQVPLPILDNRAHPIVGQAMLGGEGLEAMAIIPTYTSPPGGKPQVPLPIL